MRKLTISARLKHVRPHGMGWGLVVACFMVLSGNMAGAWCGIEAAGHNYALALEMSIYFLDIQRSGHLPEKGNAPGQYRVPWRFDSALQDGMDHGVDLTGGFYDAGDHVKFVFPMAASLTNLAWGVLEYGDGFQEAGQLPYILATLRWGTDFLLKAHAAPDVLFAQVGHPELDHRFWGPPEAMRMARPSFKVTAECPGSDLAAETAAALAATSMVFQARDPDYAALLLEHARELYDFADRYRGVYSDCVPQAAPYYASRSGYEDELAWGAVWLFQATGEATYLQMAESMFMRIQGGRSWTHSWDDKRYGTYVLLATLTGKARYRAAVERYLDFWTVGYRGERVRYTPGGLAWLDAHGPLRYAANTALMAFIYSDWLEAQKLSPERAVRYHDFAVRQIDYMLGSNPLGRSFVVGFGSHPPRTPHHRASHGSRTNNIHSPVRQRHVAYGALVGGPGPDDTFVDDRTNTLTNEVALDYNACFTGALARMTLEYGGVALAAFPPPEPATQIAANF